MFQFLGNSSSDKALVAAIGRSQAVIEFGMDGTIITANENFLKALGYALGEIQGKHHSMFVDAGGARRARPTGNSGRRLNRGEYQAAEYKRIGKGGKEIWIQASYNPFSTATASRSRSSSSPPISPRARSRAWKTPARSRRSAARRP